MKKQIICLLVCLWSINSLAQSNSVKDLYESFKQYRTTNDDKPSQIVKTLELLKFADQLTACLLYTSRCV